MSWKKRGGGQLGHSLALPAAMALERVHAKALDNTRGMLNMKVCVLCALLVACAATARAFDLDPYWKECSVERTRPGSTTALHPVLQKVCKRRNITISAGGSHTCVLSPKGSYKCIGDNQYDQS